MNLNTPRLTFLEAFPLTAFSGTTPFGLVNGAQWPGWWTLSLALVSTLGLSTLAGIRAIMKLQALPAPPPK